MSELSEWVEYGWHPKLAHRYAEGRGIMSLMSEEAIARKYNGQRYEDYKGPQIMSGVRVYRKINHSGGSSALADC